MAAAADLEKNRIEQAITLAATDVFVEKAQRLLTIRGKYLYGFGAATGILAALVMGGTAWALFHLDVSDILDKNIKEEVSASFLAIFLLKSSTAGALVAAVAYFLVALSRALLHEATVLYNRRHSLRFGRLYVYLMRNKLTPEELEKAFGWNAEFTTAFKDIQADRVTRSILTKLVESPADFLRAIGELRKGSAAGATEKGKDQKSGSDKPSPPDGQQPTASA